MPTELEQISAHVDAVLAELPDVATNDGDLDIDDIACRLEKAHDVLGRLVAITRCSANRSVPAR